MVKPSITLRAADLNRPYALDLRDHEDARVEFILYTSTYGDWVYIVGDDPAQLLAIFEPLVDHLRELECTTVIRRDEDRVVMVENGAPDCPHSKFVRDSNERLGEWTECEECGGMVESHPIQRRWVPRVVGDGESVDPF